MAKISLNKLGLNKQEPKNITITYNGIDIEIKQYLPIKEKMNIINNLIQVLYERNENFYNPAELETAKILLIIENYTNISYTDAERKDEGKLFDKIRASHLDQAILDNIPQDELCFFNNLLMDSINNIYSYSNSIGGVVERIYNTYNNSQEDLMALKDNFNNLENKDLLKELLLNSAGKNN